VFLLPFKVTEIFITLQDTKSKQKTKNLFSHFPIFYCTYLLWLWLQSWVQWAPLNGTTDNWINQLMTLNLSRLACPNYSFTPIVHLSSFTFSISYSIQFVSVLKYIIMYNKREIKIKFSSSLDQEVGLDSFDGRFRFCFSRNFFSLYRNSHSKGSNLQ